MEGKKLNRRSIRLPGYDYSQENYYFVTICAINRRCLFGGIDNFEMRLNAFGEYVKDFWLDVEKYFVNIEIDELIVMPNHLHVIIIIHDDIFRQNGENQGGETPPLHPIRIKPSIGQIIGYYKYQTTKKFGNEIILSTLLGMKNHWRQSVIISK